MLTPEEQLKQIINYADLPPSPASLKPGFFFNIKDYPLLQSLKKTEETIYLIKKDVVMQDIVVEDKETCVFLYFVVSPTSCRQAREQTISLATGMTSLPIDIFTAGPPDLGEFNIIPKHPSDKIVDMVYFVRNNIVVSLFLKKGEVDLETLVKQIDDKIRSMKDYNQDTIKSICPQIDRISLPNKKIFLNKIFKVSAIIMGKNYTVHDLLFIYEYDNDIINMEEQDGPNASFKALMLGETVINCTIVDRKNLLSSSDSITINIVDGSSDS